MPSVDHASTLDMPLDLDADASAPQVRSRRSSEMWVLGLLFGLVWFVWDISQRGLFKAGDDVGYWLGVAGGVMMLLLLLYPLRKHVRALHRWGRVKAWLWGHMVLGVGGPLLVLLHCGFRAGSLNAAAALYSMVIVASSGVMGRFLYVRVNRGLVAEHRSLQQLRLALGLEGDARTVFGLLPEVQQDLLGFEHDALKTRTRAGAHWLRLVLVLPVRSWLSRWRTQRQARMALKALGRARGWDAKKLHHHRRRVRRDIVAYYIAVMRVALFAAWERLFALWHVAHIPFVFLLVIAGVVHVVAVHAY